MHCFSAVLLFLFALPTVAQPAHGPEPEVPVRIMPVGDSITEGNDGGFRIPLINMVTQAFEMPDLVGRRMSRDQDNGVGHDHDQDGYSAYRIDQIASGEGFWGAPPIEERLDDWDPAVVLLHAGTNDAQQNYHPYGSAAQGIPNVLQRLDDLVSRIVAHAPHVYVIVAQIIPANPPASQQTRDYIVALNRRIPAMVTRHQALGHRVTMVDMYTPMLAFPNPDGIHPSLGGFQTMAEVWFEGLRAIGFLDGEIRNPNPGRDDGVRQRDYYSTSSATPWQPSRNSLIQAGSTTLQRAIHTDYDGETDPGVLNDGLTGVYNGLSDDFAQDPDHTWTSTFALNTNENAAGYDIDRIQSGAGGNEHGKLPQAYEVWYSLVDAPAAFLRLGAFQHIPVNDLQRGSALVITGLEGAPLATGVKAIQFRFTEPPWRQWGFFELPKRARYYEIEAFGTPTVPQQRAATASAAARGAFALRPAYPNPFDTATALSLDLPTAAKVQLVVHDVLGRTVATLVDGPLGAGFHHVAFDAAHLPSGTYLVRMQAEGQSGTVVRTQQVSRLR
ncbi:MAG: GDSL-type esterase/lipase family protein [Bacteroidota bacterium]